MGTDEPDSGIDRLRARAHEATGGADVVAPGGTADAGGTAPGDRAPAGDPAPGEGPDGVTEGGTAPPDADLLPGADDGDAGIPGPAPVREQSGL